MTQVKGMGDVFQGQRTRQITGVVSRKFSLYARDSTTCSLIALALGW